MTSLKTERGSLSPRVSPQSELLLALAARCEAEEPSWSLCIAIELAIRKGAVRNDSDDRTIRWGHRLYNPPEYAFSLDAAVTLVPDSAYGSKTGPMTCAIHQADDGSWWAELRDGWQTSYGAVFVGHAKTEPMARVAAALRARAALPKEEA